MGVLKGPLMNTHRGADYLGKPSRANAPLVNNGGHGPSGAGTGFQARPLAALRLVRLVRLMVTCCGLLTPWTTLALDLNTATEAELDGLSGFGPAFTARVMQARAERPFQDWADFMRRVKGVREATAGRLSRQGARIQHTAFSPPASPPARASRD
jgi:competence protein ComEA